MSTTTTSSFLEINGRPLFVEVTTPTPSASAADRDQGDPGDLTPLIVLHGLGGSTNLFPIASQLVSSSSDGLKVIRFDWEGMGKSPFEASSGKATWEMKDLVEDVKGVLEANACGGKKVVMFGHSLGAAVALYFASLYPSLVSSLILSCPVVGRAETPEGIAASLGLARTARDKGCKNMADFTASHNTSPHSHALARSLIRTVMQESNDEAYARYCELVSTTPSPDWGKVEVKKVLILCGEDDKISNVGMKEMVSENLNNVHQVQLEVISQAGHQPAVEQSDRVAELISAFLHV